MQNISKIDRKDSVAQTPDGQKAVLRQAACAPIKALCEFETLYPAQAFVKIFTKTKKINKIFTKFVGSKTDEKIP
jgi:hypothetical protein